MLEIHDVAGLPLGRDPGVDPCRKGLEKTSGLVKWPNHINLNFLTLFASRILAPMMSLISSRIGWLVRWSWYVTPKGRFPLGYRECRADDLGRSRVPHGMSLKLRVIYTCALSFRAFRRQARSPFLPISDFGLEGK